MMAGKKEYNIRMILLEQKKRREKKWSDREERERKKIILAKTIIGRLFDIFI